jgi:hypothetical protein
MPRIVNTPTPEQLKKKLSEQLEWSKQHRTEFERQWLTNGQILDNASGSVPSNTTLSYNSAAEFSRGEDDGGNIELGINYAFKFTRFTHSQLSANPPSIVASPTSADPKDKRSADAADRIARHIRRDKNLQEVVDQASLKMLKKSIGWVKVFWNPDKGDIYDFNEETREVLMEGDLDIYSPATEDVWMDPDATRWEEVKYTWERIRLSEEEAKFRFPDSVELIDKNIQRQTNRKVAGLSDTQTKSKYAPRIEIYEYYEKGLPINGNVGLRAYTLEDGELLEPATKNPHYQARLPLKAFTYIDQEESLYSKSVIDYVAPLQDNLNRLDSTVLANLEAHAVVRMVLPADAEIEDDAITNSAWDYIKIKGSGQSPHFVNAPQIMPDIWRHRESLVTGIQDLFGINDSMLGIQKREQSAVSQQTSIESGSAIHRRLFVKYAQFVEAIYKDCLGLVKDNWDEPRTVLVLGKEKAFLAAEFKGADIAGGFDLVVEHGTSLPIDPNTRREFILLNTPMFKAAGVTDKELLKLMKLDDVGGAFDRIELAGDRQKEIFEEMEMHFKKGKPIYIPPEGMEDHLSRLEWARTYLETSEFKYLPDELKELIRKHVKDRMDLAAQEAAPQGQDPLLALPDASITAAGLPGVEGAINPSVGDPLEEAGII